MSALFFAEFYSPEPDNYLDNGFDNLLREAKNPDAVFQVGQVTLGSMLFLCDQPDTSDAAPELNAL